MKVVKVKSWKELALKRFGTAWLRKPKPTKGCKSNGRRRRRRRRRLYICLKAHLLGMRSQYHLRKQKIIIWHSSVYFD
jgi:hypothetical protein